MTSTNAQGAEGRQVGAGGALRPGPRPLYYFSIVAGILAAFVFVVALSLRNAARTGWNCLPVAVHLESPDGSPALGEWQVASVSPWGSTIDLIYQEGAWYIPRDERRGIAEFLVTANANPNAAPFHCRVSLQEHSFVGDGKGLWRDVSVVTSDAESSNGTRRYRVKPSFRPKSLLPRCDKFLNWGGDVRILAYASLWAGILVGLPAIGFCLIRKRADLCYYYGKHRRSVWVALAGLSFALPYCDIACGLDFTDSPYHIVESRRFLDHPMTVLSYYLISKWQTLTGGVLLLNRVAVMLALQAVGSLLLYLGSRKIPTNLSLSLVAFNLLLSLYDSICMLSYDSLSSFFLINSFCAFYLCSEKQFRLIYLVLAAVGSSLAVASRFPNVVLIPMVISWFTGLVLSGALSKSAAFQKLGLFITLFLAVSFLIYSFFYESLSDAASRLHVGPTHTIFKLLRSYCRDISQSISWVGVFIAGAWGWTFIRQTVSFSRRTQILLCSAFCAVVVALLISANTYYNFSLSSLLVAAFAIQLVSIGFTSWRSGARCGRESCFLAFAAMFFLVSTAGSDTGLLKAAVIFLVPFLAAVHWQRYAGPIRWLLASVSVSLFIYLPFQRLNAHYEDSGSLETQAQVSHPALWGIRTTNARKAYLEDVLLNVASSSDSFIFFGRTRYIFDYLLGQSAPVLHSYSGTLDDESYIAKSKIYLEVHSIKRIFIVPDYPETKTFGQTSLERMLITIGYELDAEEENFRVYRLQLKTGSQSAEVRKSFPAIALRGGSHKSSIGAACHLFFTHLRHKIPPCLPLAQIGIKP